MVRIKLSLMDRKNGELEPLFSVSIALPEHLLEAALSCASSGISGCTGVKAYDKPWKHGQNQEINFEKVKYFGRKGNSEQRLKRNYSEHRITEGHFHPGVENKSDLFPEIR